MGTRHIIAIVQDGELKLSQYGQWDGYFDCKGMMFVDWVRDNLKHKKKTVRNYCIREFREKVACLKNVDNLYVEKFFDAIRQFSSLAQSEENSFVLPLHELASVFHRDTSVDILDIISNIKTHEYCNPNRYFPVQIETDMEFIEYVYVIDMDREYIYCMTTHNFDTRYIVNIPLPTVVQETYKNNGFEVFYASPINKLPTSSKINKYVETLNL